MALIRPRSAPDTELQHAVAQLREDVEDLGSAIADLPDRFGGVSTSLSEVRAALNQVESRSLETELTTQDLAALVKRLSARVEWLERNIRLQDEVPEAELDALDRRELELAQVAEEGHLARAGLLQPANRSSLEAAVTAHAAAVRQHTQHREAALGACEVIADTHRDDPRHGAAVAEFEISVSGLTETRNRMQALTAAALEAAELLSADEENQVAVADVVSEGERAWTALQTRLRGRVADAVGGGALLPSWFTAVLGPMPAAQDTKAWMDVATSLLAYRATYSVTDPVMALGAPPVDGENPRRRAWYHQLRRQFDDLDRAATP
jgi:chromosome segregation ATPase